MFSDTERLTARKTTGRRSCSAASSSIEEASWSWSPIASSSYTTSGQSIFRTVKRSCCWHRRPVALASRRAGRFDATDGRNCTILRSHASSTTASSVRCGGSRRGVAVLHGREAGPPREQAIGQAAAFLRANALTEGTLSAHAAGSRGGRAIVVPRGDAGYDAEQRLPPDDLTLAGCGLAFASRPAVDAVAEVFTHPGPARPRAVALWAAPGGGLRTAIDTLARTARLNGYVPLSSRLVESACSGAGGTVAAPHRSRRRGGRVAGAHRHHSSIAGPARCVAGGSEEIAHVQGLPLAPVTVSALVEAIRPRDVPVAICRRVEWAARRSRGLPGNFVSLLWGEEVRRKSHSLTFQVSGRKAGSRDDRSNRCDRQDGTSGRTIAGVRRRQ